MKIIVTLAQLVPLFTMVYALIKFGIPTRDEQGVMLLLFTIPSLMALYYIHFWSVSDIQKLMNERRLLEEQAKVDKLRPDTK
jgi:hypothetical protein